MKTEKYESPRFEFQELKLMERVADTCWGYAYAWYDVNGDGIITEGKPEDKAEKIQLVDLPGMKENGCQGNAAVEALYKLLFTVDLLTR